MLSMFKVGIILPSRGLIFSKTAEEILANITDFRRFGGQAKFFFSHRQPIPRCFESPTNRALLDETITHLWFVEDDMILPPNILRRVMSENQPVVTCDYPVRKVGQGAVLKDQSGKVIFCGTGCILVAREVFDKIRAPYFRDDIYWTVLNYETHIKLSGRNDPQHTSMTYGSHDVTFCMKLHKAGIPITVIPIKLGQRKLVELGKAGSNAGAHTIEEWTTIVPDFQLKIIKDLPLAHKGKLVSLATPTGGVTTSPAHAATLVKEGLAEYMEPTSFILDDSDVHI